MGSIFSGSIVSIFSGEAWLIQYPSNFVSSLLSFIPKDIA